MANITLKVRLRQLEGHVKCDPLEIGRALAAMVEDLGEIDVEDLEGGEVTYEVTQVKLVIDQLELEQLEPADVVNCQWCNVPVAQLPGFRRKVFCSDAHRQAAYRQRRLGNTAVEGWLESQRRRNQ